MKKMIGTIGLLLMLGFLTISSAYSQQDTTKTNDAVKSADTTKTGEDDWSVFGFDDEWNWDYKFWAPKVKLEYESPTIELIYGVKTTPKYHKDAFGGSFEDNYSVEFRLGHTDVIKLKSDENIVKYEYDYFFLANYSEDFGEKKENTDKVKFDAWRFGFSWSEGYGYKFSDFSGLILYHTEGMDWTKFDFDKNPNNQVLDPALDVYGDEFRFGDHFEAGVKLRPIKNLAINAGYEQVLVFQRHMFWYWTLSELIEVASQGILDGFIKEIGKSSPYATPVVNFILKNALSYGIYELRSKNMNWPTETAAPIRLESFKVGVTFML